MEKTPKTITLALGGQIAYSKVAIRFCLCLHPGCRLFGFSAGGALPDPGPGGYESVWRRTAGKLQPGSADWARPRGRLFAAAAPPCSRVQVPPAGPGLRLAGSRGLRGSETAASTGLRIGERAEGCGPGPGSTPGVAGGLVWRWAKPRELS